MINRWNFRLLFFLFISNKIRLLILCAKVQIFLPFKSFETIELNFERWQQKNWLKNACDKRFRKSLEIE